MKIKKPKVVDAIYPDDKPVKKKLTPLSREEVGEIKRLLTTDRCECGDCEGTMRLILAYEVLSGPLTGGKPKKAVTLERFESLQEREAREAKEGVPPSLT